MPLRIGQFDFERFGFFACASALRVMIPGKSPITAIAETAVLPKRKLRLLIIIVTVAVTVDDIRLPADVLPNPPEKLTIL